MYDRESGSSSGGKHLISPMWLAEMQCDGYDDASACQPLCGALIPSLRASSSRLTALSARAALSCDGYACELAGSHWHSSFISKQDLASDPKEA